MNHLTERWATLTKTAVASVYRGLLLSSWDGVKPWSDYPHALDPNSDGEILRAIEKVKFGSWFGSNWTSDKDVAEEFAVGTSKGCNVWSLGARPTRGAAGVVIEAVMPEIIQADDPFAFDYEQSVFGPGFYNKPERITLHVYVLKPVPEDGWVPDKGKCLRSFDLPKSKWPRR